MHVTKDSTPPVITGLKDNQMVRSGDDIDFREGITVTDDYDPSPVLTVDASKFDVNKPGKYVVYYKATDRSGNVTEATINLEVWQSSVSDLKSKEAYNLADAILKDIKKSMPRTYTSGSAITSFISAEPDIRLLRRPRFQDSRPERATAG